MIVKKKKKTDIKLFTMFFKIWGRLITQFHSQQTGSYPDEQEGVCLCQQRGQIVLDAQRLAHVLPHLGAVFVHSLYDLLSLPPGDVPHIDHQPPHLDLQVWAQPLHLGLILFHAVLKPVRIDWRLVPDQWSKHPVNLKRFISRTRSDWWFLHEKLSNSGSLVGRNFGSTGCKKHLLRESLCCGLNRFTHSHGGINILVLFEDSLSISQLLLCFYEQGLQNDLWNHTHMIDPTPVHAHTNIQTHTVWPSSWPSDPPPPVSAPSLCAEHGPPPADSPHTRTPSHRRSSSAVSQCALGTVAGRGRLADPPKGGCWTQASPDAVGDVLHTKILHTSGRSWQPVLAVPPLPLESSCHTAPRRAPPDTGGRRSDFCPHPDPSTPRGCRQGRSCDHRAEEELGWRCLGTQSRSAPPPGTTSWPDKGSLMWVSHKVAKSGFIHKWEIENIWQTHHKIQRWAGWQSVGPQIRTKHTCCCYMWEVQMQTAATNYIYVVENVFL